jgi:cation diffusion facilitator family transporter
MSERKKSRDGKRGERVLVLGILGNLFLFGLKALVGAISGSLALLNDGFNSLSDTMSSVLALIGFRASRKPKDQSHHYGHRKAEPLAGFVVSLFIVLMGAFLAYETAQRIGHPEIPGGIAVWAAVAAILLKEVLARYSLSVGRRLRSPSIKALAHDHRGDVLSSTVALVGIVGARLGFPLLDPAAGFLVALIIVYMGFRVGKENVDMLMDRAPNPDLLERIESEARSVHGVLGVHSVRARKLGEDVTLDLHVEVDPDLRMREADRIAHRVQRRLESMEEISSALPHLCPGETGTESSEL